jgi:hypothetical protein
VDLVFHHVVKLEHIHDSDGNFLFKSFSSAAVIELHLSIFLESCFLKFLADLIFTNRLVADAGVDLASLGE